MTDSKTGQNQPLPADQDQQVWETVAFFEQILQSIPDDRVSLEVLSQAYEHAGELSRACEYLLRLTDVLVREGDREAAKALHARLSEYTGQPHVAEALAKLASLVSVAPAHPRPGQAAKAAAPRTVSPMEATQHIADQSHRRQIVSQELELAWMLHEEKLMTEDQYTALVNDLAELSASTIPAPISILHLFHDRQLPNMDRALTFLAEKSGMPLLPLGAFEPQIDAGTLLPLDYLICKGVIPFEYMAQDLLVAVLNPISETLRSEVTEITGHPCHFYLVQPSEFDLTIEKLRKHLTPAAPKQPAAAGAPQTPPASAAQPG